MIDAGRRSKWRSIRVWMAASSIRPVPKESTVKLIGWAIPMP
jgi:hypothetical protein